MESLDSSSFRGLKHYVYRYIRLDTNEPFYVGKGSGDRAFRSKTGSRNKYFTSIVETIPFKIEIISKFKTNTEALEFESNLIKIYQSYGMCKANLLQRGYNNFGYRLSLKAKQNISKAGRGRAAWNKGKKLSNSHILKLSKAKSGKKYSAKYKEQMAIVKGSKPFSAFLLDGTFIGDFLSKKDCSKTLKIDRANLIKCLNGTYKQTKGYIFRYK